MDKVDTLTVRWQRIDPNGPGLHEPKLEGDVGWDLEASKDVSIQPGQAVDVPTNIRLELPPYIWAEIRARSSIARRGLQVDSGTIDNGYRGPLFALVRNMTTVRPADLVNLDGNAFDIDAADRWSTENTIQISAGERVAQVVFHVVVNPAGEEVDVIDLDSDRGEAGFGSTGL